VFENGNEKRFTKFTKLELFNTFRSVFEPRMVQRDDLQCVVGLLTSYEASRDLSTVAELVNHHETFAVWLL